MDDNILLNKKHWMLKCVDLQLPLSPLFSLSSSKCLLHWLSITITIAEFAGRLLLLVTKFVIVFVWFTHFLLIWSLIITYINLYLVSFFFLWTIIHYNIKKIHVALRFMSKCDTLFVKFTHSRYVVCTGHCFWNYQIPVILLFSDGLKYWIMMILLWTCGAEFTSGNKVVNCVFPISELFPFSYVGPWIDQLFPDVATF